MTRQLPPLFIGSSTEGLDTAYAIQQSLEYDAEPTVWTQGIFELGLFMGALGPAHCFHLVPRGLPDLHLPSDLAGITPLTYNPGRSDANLLAALGPACNQVRNAIKAGTRARTATAKMGPGVGRGTEGRAEKLQRYLDTWNGELLGNARKLVNERGVPMSLYEVEADNQPEWEAFQKIFYFLESVSASVLAGEIDAQAAQEVFGPEIVSTWSHASTALTMPDHADEAWKELPNIAVLAMKWRSA